jgi:hypothetical protein
MVLSCPPRVRTKWDMILDGEKGGAASIRKQREAQNIEALKHVEAGRTAAEVGRDMGVSKHTICAWKAPVWRPGRKRGGKLMTRGARLCRCARYVEIVNSSKEEPKWTEDSL